MVIFEQGLLLAELIGTPHSNEILLRISLAMTKDVHTFRSLPSLMDNIQEALF